MASDTVELLETLRDRFGAPAHVVGFSTGATVAAIAAARRPDLLRVLVGVGMDVDGAEAGRVVYDVVLARARATGNRRAVRQLERIGPPPHVDPHSFSTRFRWAAEFGAVSAQETYATTGRRLVASLLRSPDYSLRDAVRTLRAVVAPQVALLEEIASINLRATVPRIDVPVVLVQGRLDRIAPGDAAERYLAALRAPRKELVWFEHSAHTPQLDEPQAFRALLRRIRNGQGEEHERVA